MSKEPARNDQATAWRELHRQLAAGGAENGARPPAVRFPNLRNAVLPLAAVMMVSVPVAIAAPAGNDNESDPGITAARGEGKAVVLGKRNPRRGRSRRATSIVVSARRNRPALGLTNAARGGRAIAATCNNGGTTVAAGCGALINKGQGPAVSLQTRGRVPIALPDTSDGRVEFLNADRVDDLHASEIISQSRAKQNLDADTLDGFNSTSLIRSAFAEDASLALVGTSGNALTTTIEAPTNGFLLMSGGSDVFNFSQQDFVTCRLRFNGAIVAGSPRQLQLDGNGVTNQEEDCATQGTVPVGPGTHTIDLEGAGLASATTFDEATLQAIFIPFGSTGAQP